MNFQKTKLKLKNLNSKKGSIFSVTLSLVPAQSLEKMIMKFLNGMNSCAKI